MTVYLASIAVVVLLSLLVRNKWLTIVLFGGVTWFFAAFRDLNLGLFDTTGGYYLLFNEALTSSLGEVVSDVFESETAFFKLINKVIQGFVGSDYQAYIAILSFIYILCFCIAIMRFANEHSWSGVQITIGCIAYYSLVYFYSYTMLRQFAALSVLIAFAYPCLRKRHSIGFFVSVAFAGLLHSTALVFLIVYPLCVYLPYKNKYIFIALGVAALGSLAPRIVMSLLVSIPIPVLQVRLGYIAHGIYEAETAGVGYGTLVFLVLFALFYIWRRPKETDPFYNDLLWLVSIGIVFQGWSHVIVEFYRVAVYFIVFNAFILPERLQRIPEKNLRMISMISILGILLAYGLIVSAENAGVVPYAFCWDVGAWPC